jgi:hypothetical protein
MAYIRFVSWKRTSTQVTFWRVLEAILPEPEAGSRGVKVEMVARASDNGALVSRDIRMQTSGTTVVGKRRPYSNDMYNAQRMQGNKKVQKTSGVTAIEAALVGFGPTREGG